MPVERRDAAAVIDDDSVAIAGNPARVLNRATLRRMDGHAVIGPDVDAAELHCSSIP